ncbi:MAG: hypothetical protein Q4C85_06750 [Actinomyces sp.]|uniref:hypothetical protein n=1 Tax=Actinomyces sp. TaxID=29317 RepID=UPI0026DBF2C6|nr:hypothetical protein [Actinomyces sp.]MDO4243443.1 hypothetical protein [Actinomyces sp.]
MGSAPAADAASGRAGDRLAAARAALTLAEQRTGLRGPREREVQRALARALDGAGPDAAEGAWLEVGADTAGVLSLDGSVCALLAAAARRQGEQGWCAVVGCEGIGWAAAAEVGLVLGRVMTVRGEDLDPSTALAVTSTLLDGVDVLLLSPGVVDMLRPRDRHSLLARARERRALILTPAPWEGARRLSARLADVDQSLWGQEPAARLPPAADHRRPGAGVARVVELRAAAREMPGGRVRALTWSLLEAARPGTSWRLRVGAEGAYAEAGPL